MPAIKVKHNVEMAHRLSQQPDSKCFRIHGHSWWVELTIYGPMNAVTKMIIDFGEVKRKFRNFLDSNYDHHLLLNPEDPLLAILALQSSERAGYTLTTLGVNLTDYGDPTVENFARIIFEWAHNMFGKAYKYHVVVWEASSNAAEYGEIIPPVGTSQTIGLGE